MNKFSNHYNSLINDEFLKVPLKKGAVIIYKYLPRIEDIFISQKMAIEKATHTMVGSQAGKHREQEIKVAKAFNGIMAELACQRFIIKVLGESPENVKRYDIEREDFKYRKGEEYDIKIVRPDKEYTVEIRSSISHKTTIEEAYDRYDIIGPYTSSAKSFENLNDIYIRPFYQFTEVKETRTEDELNHLFTDLRKQTAEIYILSGAFKEDFHEHGYVKNMGQGDTQYHAIKMRDTGGAEEFIERYKSRFPINP